MSDLIGIVNNFEKKKVIVIGDVMLDRYIFGNISRISPEAPIPIVDVEDDKTRDLPGGAANTASNIKSLGGEVYLMGVIGHDDYAKLLMKSLKEKEVSPDWLVFCDRPTTVKTRVVADQQQVVRIDRERRGFINDNQTDLLIGKFKDVLDDVLDDCTVAVVSDYCKGVVTYSLMAKVIDYSHKKNKLVIVDPRPKNMGFYKNCDVITPNIAEAKAMVGDLGNNDLCRRIQEEVRSNVLLTKGNQGMTLCTKDSSYFNFDAITKGVRDVTGAGDTVVAALALSLAAGASYEQAAEISNFAAGIVVSKFGTSTTNREELSKVIREYKT